MYETVYKDGKTKGRINYTAWGEVFTCRECSQEIVFFRGGIGQTHQARTR